MALKIEAIETLIEQCFPFSYVTGDSGKWNNPHNNISLNSTENWLESKRQGTTHRARINVESLNKLANQYINARRFEVTEGFVNKVLESLQKETGYYHGKDYCGIKREMINEAFKAMWEEIEG